MTKKIICLVFLVLICFSLAAQADIVLESTSSVYNKLSFYAIYAIDGKFFVEGSAIRDVQVIRGDHTIIASSSNIMSYLDIDSVTMGMILTTGLPRDVSSTGDSVSSFIRLDLNNDAGSKIDVLKNTKLLLTYNDKMLVADGIGCDITVTDQSIVMVFHDPIHADEVEDIYKKITENYADRKITAAKAQKRIVLKKRQLAEAYNQVNELQATAKITKDEGETGINEAEADAAAYEAQKIEDEQQVAELQSEAEITRVECEAETTEAEVATSTYEAPKIEASQQAYQKQWEYEIALERAKRWNGKEVPDANYTVPGTGAAIPITVE